MCWCRIHKFRNSGATGESSSRSRNDINANLTRLYYLNPFTYLMGSLLTFTMFDRPVNCKTSELAIFDTPNGQTCASYLSEYMSGLGSRTNLLNPEATSGCKVCQYRVGSDYLYTLNLKNYYYGWRDAAICVVFVISSYGMVYALMKLRTKASKKAE